MLYGQVGSTADSVREVLPELLRAWFDENKEDIAANVLSSASFVAWRKRFLRTLDPLIREALDGHEAKKSAVRAAKADRPRARSRQRG